MDYREFAVSIARQAGEIMRTNFTLGMKREWKQDGTPLTATDLQINALVVENITKQFFDHGILGEEQSHMVEGSDYIWVCDPVDGTMPFAHGIPISTFSLALTHKGRSILGVVYDPYLDRMYVGELGKGTTLNEQIIHASDSTSLENAAINIEGDKQEGISAELGKYKVRRMKLYSTIYPTALVAAGAMTATIFNLPHPWDAAAIKVIVDEAGGKVTDLYGNDQRYDQPTRGYIASNGHVHDQLVQFVGKVLES